MRPVGVKTGRWGTNPKWATMPPFGIDPTQLAEYAARMAEEAAKSKAAGEVVVGSTWKFKASGYKLVVTGVTGDKASIDYDSHKGVEVPITDIVKDCEKLP